MHRSHSDPTRWSQFSHELPPPVVAMESQLRSMPIVRASFYDDSDDEAEAPEAWNPSIQGTPIICATGRGAATPTSLGSDVQLGQFPFAPTHVQMPRFRCATVQHDDEHSLDTDEASTAQIGVRAPKKPLRAARRKPDALSSVHPNYLRGSFPPFLDAADEELSQRTLERVLRLQMDRDEYNDLDGEDEGESRMLRDMDEMVLHRVIPDTSKQLRFTDSGDDEDDGSVRGEHCESSVVAEDHSLCIDDSGPQTVRSRLRPPLWKQFHDAGATQCDRRRREREDCVDSDSSPLSPDTLRITKPGTSPCPEFHLPLSASKRSVSSLGGIHRRVVGRTSKSPDRQRRRTEAQ